MDQPRSAGGARTARRAPRPAAPVGSGARRGGLPPARNGLPGLDPTALGHLLGELHDRDLEWHPEAPLRLARALDGSLLVVRASLRPASEAGLRSALDLARLDERDPAAVHAFAEAYAARHRGGAADRQRARARAEEALS